MKIKSEKKGFYPVAGFIVLVFLMSIICSVQVSAIGIGPGKTDITFSPGLVQKIDFIVQGTGGVANYDIYIKDKSDGGALESMVKCDKSTIILQGGEWGEFSCTITLPSYMTPGSHEVRVGFIEKKSSAVTTGTISVLAAVESRIAISVPYDGFYPKLGIYVNNTKKNENANFLVTVKNWGNKAGTASADVDVYNENNEKVGSVKTDAKFVDTMQSDSLSAQWLANVDPGKYRATARTLVGSNEEINATTTFIVGDLLLNIVNLSSDITADEIGKFTTVVESLWPEQINFELGIQVLNADGTSIGSRKDTFVIGAWGSKAFDTIWDNKISQPGNYKANITLVYNGKTTNGLFDFAVKEKAKTLIPTQSIPQMIIWILIIIILLLAVMFVALLLMGRKKSKHTQKPVKAHPKHKKKHL